MWLTTPNHKIAASDLAQPDGVWYKVIKILKYSRHGLHFTKKCREKCWFWSPGEGGEGVSKRWLFCSPLKMLKMLDSPLRHSCLSGFVCDKSHIHYTCFIRYGHITHFACFSFTKLDMSHNYEMIWCVVIISWLAYEEALKWRIISQWVNVYCHRVD